jgi:NAD(P)-dependent dehydrogenase (short-subunit alcohol dehydrogenase family)
MPNVVLITGASTGFGFRSAKQLARQGYHVYASMRQVNGKNAPFAGELRDFASTHHCKLEPIELDVTDEVSVNGAVAQIAAQAGKIDVLVNNAGIWGPGVLEAFSMDDWKGIFEVNLFGSVRAARAVLPYMRRAGSGLIVQISSLQGRFILPYSGPYVASKFAVEAAMETFRYESAPYGVDVCIIQPYDFMTEMKQKAASHQPTDAERNALFAEANELIQKMYLVPDPGRVGDPQEVVDAISTLIGTPAGTRPIRTTVRNPMPQIEQINLLSVEMHAQLFPYIGLGDLLHVKLREQDGVTY